MPQGKSAWKVRDGVEEERDKYYGGFQQVGENYLFKSKDSAKLVIICLFFFGWNYFAGPKGEKQSPKAKNARARGETRKKSTKKAKNKRKALNERGNTAAPC